MKIVLSAKEVTQAVGMYAVRYTRQPTGRYCANVRLLDDGTAEVELTFERELTPAEITTKPIIHTEVAND